MSKLYPFFRMLGILLAVVLLIAPIQTWLAHAQSTDETSWTSPVNLSNSGLTSLPAIISDKNGVVHVVWQDDTLGSMYAQLVDGAWSQPVVAKFPFTDFVPRFINGSDYIHAFWLNTSNDSLYHSRIASDKFGAGGNWERAKALAKGVEDFQVVYQDDNTLHLAYMTSLEDAKTQAGTYYLRSIDGGVKWEAAKQIYTSRYFRALDPSLANVDISATLQDDKQTVYLVWNNPALKRVFLSRWAIPLRRRQRSNSRRAGLTCRPTGWWTCRRRP